MRKYSIAAVLVAIVSGMILTVAASGASGGFKATPSEFNPGGAPVTIQAAWVSHTGDPAAPDAGASNHGLILSISATVTYPPGASADATITKVDGVVLSSLSFEHKIGTYCTNGSPRFDVETQDGGVYAYGCASGTHTPIAGSGSPGWEKITFSCADQQNLSGPTTCAFGKALSFLQLLQDEGGSSTNDNLALNGHVMGKPGLSK
jgi:hypothetical protein